MSAPVRLGTKIIWVLFLLAVLARWIDVQFFEDGTSDGGGPCAIIGFGVLVILLIGTVWEVAISKRESRDDR